MAISDYALPALILLVCLDVVFFLGQASVTELQPATVFYNCDGRFLDSAGNCLNNSYSQDPRSQLPDTTLGTEPTTGNIFTDIFNSIKTFFVEKTGLGDIFLILLGPVGLLGALGLPAAFTFAIGAGWAVITFFIVISFLWGR